MSMMTAQLTFDLTEPDGKEMLKQAIDAPKMLSVMESMDNWFREKLKYGHQFANVDNGLEEARKALHEFLKEENIALRT